LPRAVDAFSSVSLKPAGVELAVALEDEPDVARPELRPDRYPLEIRLAHARASFASE